MTRDDVQRGCGDRAPLAGDHKPRHPDFEPGNAVARRHGAYSPRLVREAGQAVVIALVEELAPEAPWLRSPVFQLELEAYCDAVAARRMLADDIAERRADGKQVPLRSFEVLASLTNAAGRAADRLGLAPNANARLLALLPLAKAGQETLADSKELGASTSGYQERYGLTLIDGTADGDEDDE